MLLKDMVLQKRIDYGFNGYQVPVIPRALRSARRRRSFGKKVEDNQMYAFELLATVAGELLLEKESSAPSNVSAGRVQFPIGRDSIKQEEHDEKKQFKQETCDQGSCDESASVFTLGSQRHGCDYAYKEYSHIEEDSTRRLASVVTKSETPENISCAAESVIGESKKEHGNFPCTTHEKFHVERGSPGCAESYDGKMEDEIKRQRQVEQKRTGSMRSRAVSDMFNLEDPMETDIKPSALVSSDSSVDVHMYGSHNPCSLFTRCRDDAKLVSRDDDENSSGCTQRSTSTLKSCRSPHFGDRKIRKLMASKYWKEAPSMLKLAEQTNSELETSPVSRIRRTCYTRQRTQRCSFKRRKLYERISASTPDQSVSGEVSNSPEKGISGEETCQGATIHWASRSSSSMVGHRSSLEPRDSHVKLKIKSFRVPELFIEIPETATIGSLKRTVMEAVTAVLGGGLRVGVLLQGKKLRDDNETLLQTGISHDDTLGFTLEPTTPVNPPAPRCPEDSQCMLPCDTNQQTSRYLPVPASDLGMSEAAPETPGLSIIGSSNHVEGDHDSVHFHPNMSMEKATPDSKALVAIPAMNAEALAVVPLDRKSKRTDLVQRRIRRPFSVSEVEALVQAVEKLGTGRWRDVKLRAFENAKHRTYVDLKDKWKTLVHTARISPQQRRGEPVPQELLDRVLSAHSYWSEHPSKQHIKHQHPEPCLLH